MKTLRRVVITTPLLFVLVSFSVFAMMAAAPGDPAVDLAGQNAKPEDIARVRSELGLDQPLLVRYWDWLSGAVTGDFGISYSRRQPVSELISSRLEPTLSLALVAIFFAVIIGVGFGILATVRPGGIVDRFVSVISSIGIALPQFWVGMLLVMVFSLQLKAMPATGYVHISDGLAPWAAHVILPALALSLMPAAELMRHVRSSVSEVLDKDFVLTARAKGMLTGPIYFKHVVRNAGIPIVTVLGIRIAQLLGGTVVIETLFGIQGLGTLTVDSVLGRDMPTILGVVALATGCVLVINLLVDLSYRFIDPRTAQ
ncbi:ABC transporter permease [Rhodococcus sp. BH4]|jgi:peptide/nickel transport system permease protein|uniref:ABC transporter permease n=1 Tax=Rhodococcus sp. BH4 TaxID=1807790 RepID=UPI0009DA3B0C|nr:ABC transporter permease [Rhodococcus sp. BH4]